MRSGGTRRSARLTLLPGGAGLGNNGSAYTTSGLKNPDGITSHRIQSQALSELLNDLEREVEALESRFLEVLDMWSTDILRPAGRLLSIINSATIRNC